jgi:hypothetical protein
MIKEEERAKFPTAESLSKFESWEHESDGPHEAATAATAIAGGGQGADFADDEE